MLNGLEIDEIGSRARFAGGMWPQFGSMVASSSALFIVVSQLSLRSIVVVLISYSHCVRRQQITGRHC